MTNQVATGLPVGGQPNAAGSEAACADVPPAGGRRVFWGLALGSVGVVFGDIGTSPLYAMREALAHTRGGPHEAAVLGVISLVIWALTLIVTVKYVTFLMQADNRGEGGTLALMALAQRALGRHSVLVFFLGMVGASLFYGDGIITPAISVLSAVEGVRGAPMIGHLLGPYIVPVAAGILIALFLAQAKGTHRVASLFGPITVVWFLVLGALGLAHLSDDLSVFRALNPWYGARFIIDNGFLGFVILGSVFLAVTGAEALYLDMGHFGKNPIRAAWLVLVFPCLALNYLGQGAVVLHHPNAWHDPFWAMAPGFAYWPILVLATAATVIASQAVISGAFSMTQQAVQLGTVSAHEHQADQRDPGRTDLRAVRQRLADDRRAAAGRRLPDLQPAGVGLRDCGDRLDVRRHPAGLCRRAAAVEMVAGADGEPAGPPDARRHHLHFVQPAEDTRRRLVPADPGRRVRGGDVDLDARYADPHREDTAREPAAGRPDRHAERAAAQPRAGHGGLFDLRSRHHADGADAQPQAQHGAAQEQHHPHGSDRRHARAWPTPTG